MYILPTPGYLCNYKEKVSFLGRKTFSESWDRPRTMKILSAEFMMARMEGCAFYWLKGTLILTSESRVTK